MKETYNNKDVACWGYNKITRKPYPVLVKYKDKYYKLIQQYNKKNDTKNYQPEQFKEAKDYETYYEAGTNGTIRTKYQNKELSKKQRKDNYEEVRLFKEKKGNSQLVHRIVAKTYIGEHEGFNYVNHLDEDKTNNEINNLVFTTMKENDNYGTRNKRISEAIRKYKKRKGK